jgi:hypothetical protein
MTEPFSFSKNLTSTFKMFRKEHGFKKKGVKFTKQFESHVGEIYFQRSSWNLPDMPFEMYINIGYQSGHGRLDKPI